MEPTLDLYRKLPAAKAQPLKLKLTAADPFTPTYVKSVVTQSSNPGEIYASRVHGRTLMLENTKESRARTERAEKKVKAKTEKERKKLGVLGRRQGTARQLGLWGFDKSQVKFSLFLPLHHLWMGYMSEMLNLPPPSSGPPRAPSSVASIHPKLGRSSLTKNTAIHGISGIVIHETKRTFKVVTKENKLKVLPKQNSIFTFQ
ncbi:hypothetical protein C8J57DRAFT_1508169 [Mycena rebaudengoi]|nr:hypothetical protein C8J57DRAFT_1508169 [Mycena rebaudengoi]